MFNLLKLVIWLIFLFFTHASCQSIQKGLLSKSITVEIKKTDRATQYKYKRGSLNEMLVLKLEINNFTISIPRSRIRLFINLIDSNASTSIEDIHYLGSISNFPLEKKSEAYIFNLSNYLDKLTEEQALEIIEGKIYLTFVAVPFKKEDNIETFELNVSTCILDVDY